MKRKFDFNDILITPAVLSDIDSRSEINIYDENGMLPLFTAPMDTVIDEYNIKYFTENKIYGIIPRQKEYKQKYSIDKKQWISVGLKEFEKFYIKDYDYAVKNLPEGQKYYVLIDIANGHMLKLYNISKKAKELYEDKLILMVGNIANPEAYKLYADIGIDMVRLGIGFGSGCLTTEQTKTGYPMASLIKETYEIKKKYNLKTKIVADGGFKSYSDIISGLGLGADYIMLGSIFNKALESCADTYLENINHGDWKEPGKKIDQYSDQIKMNFHFGTHFYKMFRGMSTKEVQRSLGKNDKDIKTSEGIVKLNKVEYTLDGWTENFKHYLSSNMSYTNFRKLKNYIGNVKFIFITEHAYKRFHK